MAAGGGGSKKGAGGTGGKPDKDKKHETQPRDPAGPGGAIDGGSGSGPGAKASGGGTGGGGGNQPSGAPKKPGTGYVDAIDDPVAKKNQEVNADAQDLDEGGWFDSWGSFMDHLGKFVGSGVGLGEREQTFTETAMDMAYGGATPADGDPTNDAHWGWDPTVAAAGLLGGAAFPGGGILAGMAADEVSSELGRPLDIDLGTDPLGGGSTPDGDTGDGGDTGGGSDDPDGNDDTGGDLGGGGGVSGTLGRGRSKRTSEPTSAPETPDAPQGSETVTPAVGTGVDIVTQTGTSGPGVNVPEASKRRRRGTLGGLGAGGLAL